MIYDILNNLDIKYEELEHNAIYTVEDAIKENIISKIDGIGCKNLFVKNKNNYYLIFIDGSKKVDLKKLSNLLAIPRLSFASLDELKEILDLDIGSVTPFGIINDKDNRVILLIDKSLRGNKVLVHPNINTKTISLKYNDLLKVIDYTRHKYIEIDFS